ncbi:hypothetical protein DFJ73DRAFT_761204 [Zopfochytrium polystomum]|nr:hypothetical protein DFJ73DRAFT_761204 [Zopfochytrium polystomum]
MELDGEEQEEGEGEEEEDTPAITQHSKTHEGGGGGEVEKKIGNQPPPPPPPDSSSSSNYTATVRPPPPPPPPPPARPPLPPTPTPTTSSLRVPPPSPPPPWLRGLSMTTTGLRQYYCGTTTTWNKPLSEIGDLSTFNKTFVSFYRFQICPAPAAANLALEVAEVKKEDSLFLPKSISFKPASQDTHEVRVVPKVPIGNFSVRRLRDADLPAALARQLFLFPSHAAGFGVGGIYNLGARRWLRYDSETRTIRTAAEDEDDGKTTFNCSELFELDEGGYLVIGRYRGRWLLEDDRTRVALVPRGGGDSDGDGDGFGVGVAAAGEDVVDGRDLFCFHPHFGPSTRFGVPEEL